MKRPLVIGLSESAVVKTSSVGDVRRYVEVGNIRNGPMAAPFPRGRRGSLDWADLEIWGREIVKRSTRSRGIGSRRWACWKKVRQEELNV